MQMDILRRSAPDEPVIQTIDDTKAAGLLITGLVTWNY
jgi:hypothetical protein